MNKHKKDTPYIKHIIDSINDIDESVRGLSKKEFKENKDVRDAAIRRLEVIGEAAKNISEETKKKNNQVEWTKLSGTRDILIHHYFGVDLNIVWEIIKKDLPELKNKIKKILRDNV